MKKALLINGSPHREGCTFTALAELQKALDGAGVAGDLLWLGTKPMQDCTSCGRCEATGLCVFGDQVNEVLDQLDDYGAIVAGSPVYYSGRRDACVRFSTAFSTPAATAWPASWGRPWCPAGAADPQPRSSGSISTF